MAKLFTSWENLPKGIRDHLSEYYSNASQRFLCASAFAGTNDHIIALDANDHIIALDAMQPSDTNIPSKRDVWVLIVSMSSTGNSLVELDRGLPTLGEMNEFMAQVNKEVEKRCLVKSILE